MYKKFPAAAQVIMDERFKRDRLIALATTEGKTPWVRAVNSYYEDGAFYVITYDRSNKMRQIQENPIVSICGEWFTAHGIGENLGPMSADTNTVIAEKLRAAFSAWIHNGHINEADPHTCILRIKLTEGELLSHGTRYEIDF